jgi:hypothetical protein
VTSVLDDLTRLEVAVAGLAPESDSRVGHQETRGVVVARLRRMVETLSRVPGGPSPAETAAEEIDEASDDEIFARLDRRLGVA